MANAVLSLPLSLVSLFSLSSRVSLSLFLVSLSSSLSSSLPLSLVSLSSLSSRVSLSLFLPLSLFLSLSLPGVESGVLSTESVARGCEIYTVA